MSDSSNDRTRPAWFAEARFGMFIHWGLYSNPAGIWKGQKIKHPYAENRHGFTCTFGTSRRERPFAWRA